MERQNFWQKFETLGKPQKITLESKLIFLTLLTIFWQASFCQKANRSYPFKNNGFGRKTFGMPKVGLAKSSVRFFYRYNHLLCNSTFGKDRIYNMANGPCTFWHGPCPYAIRSI